MLLGGVRDTLEMLIEGKRKRLKDKYFIQMFACYNLIYHNLYIYIFIAHIINLYISVLYKKKVELIKKKSSEYIIFQFR